MSPLVTSLGTISGSTQGENGPNGGAKSNVTLNAIAAPVNEMN